MPPERRVPSHAGLRDFYQEQWDHVQQLLQEWRRRRADARKEGQAVSDAVEKIVDGTDARMRCVSAYKKKLRGGVRALLQHVEALVDGLPGVIVLNQRSYNDDPLINAIFANKQEIGLIFGHSRELHRYFSTRAGNHPAEAYAVLVVTKEERTTFGVGLQGNIVVRDVRQTTVSFTGHEILTVRSTEQQLRESLKETLINSVTNYLHASLPRLLFRTTQIPHNEKFICTGIDLKNPNTYLNELVATLHRPHELLKSQRRRLKISKMGVLVPRHSTETVNDIIVNEISVGALPARIFVLVRHRNDEIPSM